MNIKKLIQREAPRNNDHDLAYAQALKESYDLIKNNSKDQLLFYQKFATDMYAKHGATHKNTARCTIIYELLKQKYGVE